MLASYLAVTSGTGHASFCTRCSTRRHRASATPAGHERDLGWERFDGTATDFLIALVTGQIDTRRLGAPIFLPPPRFDEVVAGALLPRPGQP